VAAVREQDLAPSITEHLPLADAAEAVHRLEHKSATRSSSADGDRRCLLNAREERQMIS
jgi:hypothetical protein